MCMVTGGEDGVDPRLLAGLRVLYARSEVSTTTSNCYHEVLQQPPIVPLCMTLVTGNEHLTCIDAYGSTDNLHMHQ
jgi:hypothetical protein